MVGCGGIQADVCVCVCVCVCVMVWCRQYFVVGCGMESCHRGGCSNSLARRSIVVEQSGI